MILGYNRPAISQLLDARLAGINHGLYGKNHACFKFQTGFGFAVMQNLRIFMKYIAYAMTAKFSDYAIAKSLNITLYGITYITKITAMLDRTYTTPHRHIAGFTQPFCLY